MQIMFQALIPKRKTINKRLAWAAATAGVFILTILSFALWQHSEVKQTFGKLPVVATIFPIYDFARAIGGDKIELTLLVPPGTDPHEFEPSPAKIAKIAQAKVFASAGNSLDPWSKSVAAAIDNPDQIVVDATSGINTGAKGAAGSTTDSNPHVWLDFANAQIMIGNIALALAKADPQNQEQYRQNAAAYQKQLADLDQKYKLELSTCKTKTLVEGGHDAFGFMARRYGLTYLPSLGADPDAEALPQKLAQLAAIIKNNKLDAVFFEELESEKNARVLAGASGARLLAINPGETISASDFANKTTVIQIMEKNLANLKDGLRCQ